MRIEPGQHAVDRRLDELAVVGLLHIVGAHPLEHVAEQAELPIGLGGGRLRARSIEHDAGLGCDQRHGYACRRAEEYQGRSAHDHPGTSGLRLRPPWAWIDGAPVLTELGLAPPALATADTSPITTTGSPVTTNCPKSTDTHSIPASKT